MTPIDLSKQAKDKLEFLMMNDRLLKECIIFYNSLLERGFNVTQTFLNVTL